MSPTLFVLSGLPGVGKSTMAKRICKAYSAAYIRIDTLEQALRDLCHIDVQGEGYRTAYRIASDNLRLGLNVVADCCNPIELTRKEWKDVAKKNNCTMINIEVICSDKNEHRNRVENRAPDAHGMPSPTWQEVVEREYLPWSEGRIRIDTAGKSVQGSWSEISTEIDKALTNK